MAVAVNLIPVTGQPLPLISRGGTSTLITCAYFGLILSADRFGISKKKEDEQLAGNNEDNNGLDEPDSSKDEDFPVGDLEDKVEFEIYQV